MYSHNVIKTISNILYIGMSLEFDKVLITHLLTASIRFNCDTNAFLSTSNNK